MAPAGEISHGSAGIAAPPTSAMELAGEGIAGCWFPGEPHDEVVSRRQPQHSFVIRLSFGRGREALASDKLVTAQWRAGTIEYRPAGVDHRHMTVHASDWMEIRVSEPLFADLGDAGGRPAPSTPVPAGSFASPSVGAKAQALRRTIATAKGAPLPEREALLCELASLCASALSGKADDHRRLKLSPGALNRVVDHVEANLGNELGIGDLAEVSGKSRFHFAKAFKDATGQSPYAYILARRLERARILLSRTGRGIAEIAQATGFSSQSHLNHALKAATGMTPLQYRRNFG